MSAQSAIIVLGAPNDQYGKLSDISVSRCEKAFSELESKGKAKIICTGGFGEHFNQTPFPHALYCKQYLMNKGVDEQRFLELVESRFTFEDATLSLPFLMQHKIQTASVVTSDFHIERVRLIFDGVFSQMKQHIALSYCAAPTPVTEEVLLELKAHERKAIEREKQNLASLLGS